MGWVREKLTKQLGIISTEEAEILFKQYHERVPFVRGSKRF